MRSARTRFWGALGRSNCWLMLLGLAVLTGCPNEQAELAREQAESNLRPLAVLIGQYVAQHRGTLPPNEAALKEFMGEMSPEDLSAYGASDVDSLFISPRDGKPYVVYYAEDASADEPMPDILAYEQEGIEGQRMVATNLGGVDRLDAAEFEQHVPWADNP